MVGKLSAEGLHGQFDFITMAGDASIVYAGRDVPFGHALAGAPVGLVGPMQVALITSGTPYGVLVRVEADKTVVVGKGNSQEMNIGATPPTVGRPVVAGAGNVVVAPPAATANSEPLGAGTVIDIDVDRGICWVDFG